MGLDSKHRHITAKLTIFQSFSMKEDLLATTTFPIAHHLRKTRWGWLAVTYTQTAHLCLN
jgi:hypothetical protein